MPGTDAEDASGEVTIRCKHCHDPIVIANDKGEWSHLTPGGSRLFSCQHTVKYGTTVAEPVWIDAETAAKILASWRDAKGDER